MNRLCLLAASALVVTLSACATETPPATPLAVAPASAKPAIDTDATPFGLFLAGRSALHQGKLDDAANYMVSAAAAEGDPDYLKSHAFESALLAGDVDQAAGLAPALDDEDAASAKLGVLVRGLDALAQDRFKDASVILNGPDVGYPHKLAAELTAPWAAAGAGDIANAVYRPIITSDANAQFVADLDQAQLYERVGKLPEAEAAYKAMAAAGDGGEMLTLTYGAFLERHGRRSEAAAFYQQSLAANPDDTLMAAAKARTDHHGRVPAMVGVRQGAADALVIPAAEAIAQKDGKTALEYLRLALKLDPTRDQAWMLVGDLLADSNDEDGARAAYAEVGPGSARYVAARAKLAWSYQNGGDSETALKLARDTAQVAPDSREAQVTLADLLRENDQYPQSAAVLDKLIEQAGPKADWRLYFLRASAYDEAGDWPKAEADLQTALKISPDEPELLNFLGYGWVDRGVHLQEALGMLQKAVAAEPQSGAMLDSLGWAYYRLGDYKNAIDELEQAIAVDPSDPDVNNHLGDAYWKAGRKIEAQFQWRRVLTLEPDDAMKARIGVKLGSPEGPDAAPAKTASQ